MYPSKLIHQQKSEYHPTLNPTIGGLNQPPLTTTAGQNAGIEGLWRLGIKANKMALAMKLIEDMDKECIGESYPTGDDDGCAKWNAKYFDEEYEEP